MNGLLRLAYFAATCGAIVAVLFTGLLSFDRGWREGVPAGIGAGAAFGSAVFVFEALWTLAARLVQSFRRRAQPSFPGETIVKVGEARHVVGIETMLGSLCLTNKALHFRAHSGDARAHRWRVGLDQVEGAEATRVLGIVSSGLRIVTVREAELFVTDDDRGWVRAISSVRKVPVELREPDQS